MFDWLFPKKRPKRYPKESDLSQEELLGLWRKFEERHWDIYSKLLQDLKSKKQREEGASVYAFVQLFVGKEFGEQPDSPRINAITFDMWNLLVPLNNGELRTA